MIFIGGFSFRCWLWLNPYFLSVLVYRVIYRVVLFNICMQPNIALVIQLASLFTDRRHPKPASSSGQELTQLHF